MKTASENPQRNPAARRRAGTPAATPFAPLSARMLRAAARAAFLPARERRERVMTRKGIFSLV